VLGPWHYRTGSNAASQRVVWGRAVLQAQGQVQGLGCHVPAFNDEMWHLLGIGPVTLVGLVRLAGRWGWGVGGVHSGHNRLD